MEEPYIKGVESRRIDLGHEILQVFADSEKEKLNESEEDRTCGWMRTSGFPDRAG
jgi:hypothetical protein